MTAATLPDAVYMKLVELGFPAVRTTPGRVSFQIPMTDNTPTLSFRVLSSGNAVITMPIRDGETAWRQCSAACTGAIVRAGGTWEYRLAMGPFMDDDVVTWALGAVTADCAVLSGFCG